MQIFWFEQTAADVPPDDGWLSSGELERMSLLRIPKRRADWRLGRWTAKQALSACIGPNSPPAADVEIRASDSGAPEVFFAGHPAPVAISLSHRDGASLCALAPGGAELGCDLEVIEPHSYAFVSDFFTAEEQALVARTPATERWRVVALLWSAKESALKAARTGLRADTRSVSASTRGPQFGEGWHPLEVRLAPARLWCGWWSLNGRFVRSVVAHPPSPAPISATMGAAYGITRMLA